MNKFLSHFFTAHQQRLELLYIGYRKHKGRDPSYAGVLFEHFRIGLETHMRWEAQLLFPPLQQCSPKAAELVELASREQQQIRDQVAWLVTLRGKAMESHDEEQRLEYQLCDYFENEEFNLYPACDRYFDTDITTRILLAVG